MFLFTNKTRAMRLGKKVTLRTITSLTICFVPQFNRCLWRTAPSLLSIFFGDPKPKCYFQNFMKFFNCRNILNASILELKTILRKNQEQKRNLEFKFNVCHTFFYPVEWFDLAAWSIHPFSKNGAKNFHLSLKSVFIF